MKKRAANDQLGRKNFTIGKCKGCSHFYLELLYSHQLLMFLSIKLKRLEVERAFARARRPVPKLRLAWNKAKALAGPGRAFFQARLRLEGLNLAGFYQNIH